MKKTYSENIKLITDEPSVSILEDILSETSLTTSPKTSHESQMGQPCAGQVLDVQDPEDKERLLVRVENSKGNTESWLVSLRDLQCQIGDTVLVQYLENLQDPVVVGVLNVRNSSQHAQSRMPNNNNDAQHEVVLADGKEIKILTENNKPLISISNTDSGPQVKLLCDDAKIDLPGNLELSADRINLHAKKGKVEVSAADDVIIQGKDIYLN